MFSPFPARLPEGVRLRVPIRPSCFRRLRLRALQHGQKSQLNGSPGSPTRAKGAVFQRMTEAFDGGRAGGLDHMTETLTAEASARADRCDSSPPSHPSRF